MVAPTIPGTRRRIQVTSGRIQRGSGHFHLKNNKLKNKDEVFGRSSWQDPRGRKKEWRPVHNKACQSGHGIEDGS